MTLSESSRFQELLRRVREGARAGFVHGLKGSPVVIAVGLVLLHTFITIAHGRELYLSIQLAVFLFLAYVLGQTALGAVSSGIGPWFDKSKPSSKTRPDRR